MRKLLCVIIALAMLLSAMSVTGLAADYSTRLPFSDTKRNAWYAEFVEYMYAEDLMFGKGNGKFQPQAGMTRAEMATLLSRIAGADVSGYAETAKQFSDIKGKEWFAEYIGWAVSEGLLSGYPEGTMKPNASILRQEIVTIISRFADKLALTLPSDTAVPAFKDAKRIGSFAVEHVEKLAKAGIISGDDKGNFNPKKSLTRAEASKIIMMLHEIMADAATVPAPELSYNRDTAENYKVWGAKHFYYAGTAYCGNMTATLNENGELPAINFEDIVGADRDGQRKHQYNISSAPWYIGVDPMILKVDTAKYPIFSMKIDVNGRDGIDGKLTTAKDSASFSATLEPTSDGFYTVTVDLREIGDGRTTFTAEDLYARLTFYPYGEDTDAGDVSLQYLGFFKTADDAKAFAPSSIADYMKTYTTDAKIDWREYTDSVKNKYEDAMAQRIDDIMNAKDIDPATIDGTCYYVSSVNGDDSNDGLSPETPWKTLEKLYKIMAGGKVIMSALKNGDAVFFERGSVFNSSVPGILDGHPENPENKLKLYYGITYAAYGEGDKPLFTHALMTGSDTGTWIATEYKNVYVLDKDLTGYTNIGNIVFERDGKCGWGIQILPTDFNDPFKAGSKAADCKMVTNGFGDYYYSGNFALENPGSLCNELQYLHDMKDNKLYLYCSEGNPADVFDKITLSGNGVIISGFNKEEKDDPYLLVDNLSVKYTGFHGIQVGESDGLVIQNCEFGWIGGAISGGSTCWGNAIENWGACYDMTIKNCYIYQVFDAAVTTQSSTLEYMGKFVAEGNVLDYSNYAIEIWGGNEYDGIRISDNYITNTGYHFGNQRDWKNGCFNSGTSNYECVPGTGWVMENNVMMHSVYSAHIGWMFSTDYIDTGVVSKNNVYVLSSKRAFLYRGFEDITVKYAGDKSDYMYVPYTERYLQQFADLGVEGGSTFYHYNYDYDELESKGVYRMGF